MKAVGFLYAVKRLFIIVVVLVIIYILHVPILQEINILEEESSNDSQANFLNGRFVPEPIDGIEGEGVCGFEDLVGHTDVYSIETPLNETMRRLTPSFDDLRKRFNRTTRIRFKIYKIFLK